jgi:hypothetical protein
MKGRGQVSLREAEAEGDRGRGRPGKGYQLRARRGKIAIEP